MSFEWNVYVAPICDEGLLGMDFLFAQEFLMGAHGLLELNGRPVKTEVEGGPPSMYKVNLVRDTVVPAYSEFIVDGRANYNGSSIGVIEPIHGTPILDVVTVGATLVDWSQHNTTVPVRVLNSSMEDIRLHQGMTLGQICEVTEVAVLAGEENTELDHSDRTLSICRVHQGGALDKAQNKTKPNPTTKLPDHVQDLFRRSAEGLTLEERAQLERLVGKHAELFAKSPTDLGRTSLVCHKIDTGDARPVKQAPRRPPMAFAQEEQKIIKQQLDAGVIRKSTSAWASPLVYVKKRRVDPTLCGL
jgi:hypothetical protein